MHFKTVAAPKQIYLFRHGHSRANSSSARKMLFPKFFKLMNNVVGFDLTLKAVHLLDRARNKYTPYKQPDSLIPLKRVGHKQAELTGKDLAEKNIIPDLILCSDYLRTRQTTKGILKGLASILNEDFSSRVLYSEVIVERRSGKTAGFPKEYLEVLFPETHREYHSQDRYEFRPPGGESILDVRNNRVPALLDIIEAIQFETLFIVGHGLTNSCIRSLLTGEDMKQVRIGSKNLGVYRFWFDSVENHWRLDPRFDGLNPISDEIPLTE